MHLYTFIIKFAVVWKKGLKFLFKIKCSNQEKIRDIENFSSLGSIYSSSTVI